MYIIKIFRPFLFMCSCVMRETACAVVRVCVCACASSGISRVACAHNSFCMFIFIFPLSINPKSMMKTFTKHSTVLFRIFNNFNTALIISGETPTCLGK